MDKRHTPPQPPLPLKQRKKPHPPTPPPPKKEKTHSLIMHRNDHIRPDEPDELDPLLAIHRHHDQRHARARDRGAAQMHEHEVDGGVALRDLGELGDEEGVAGDVDVEGGVEG